MLKIQYSGAELTKHESIKIITQKKYYHNTYASHKDMHVNQ